MSMRNLRVIAALLVLTSSSFSAAQEAAPAPAAGPVRLELGDGSIARYRVREQLAGISFFSDAVGTTTGVTGTIVLDAKGVVNPAQSKIVVDLRTLKSDQDMRDGYVRGDRLLNVEKFPTVEFVPKRIVGMPWPMPTARGSQAGFQMIGDLTIRGVTKEVTWNAITTFNADQVAGRAVTDVKFESFSLPKPALARLLSVADDINLELEFRFKRAAM